MAIGFDMHEARDALKRAKRALKAAEDRFETDVGPDNTFSLIAEIKDAERRVADAQTALTRLRQSETN
jgi:hypothetical protein